jgi:uncharacterized membrane protein
MDGTTLWVVLLSFLSFGSSVFITKLATSRIGLQTALWHEIGFAPLVMGFCLISCRWRGLIQADRAGVFLAVLAGAIASLGGIALTWVLARTDASTIVPLAALYPALTVVLAIVFLKEGVTPGKVLGVFLSIVSIYLLARF